MATLKRPHARIEILGYSLFTIFAVQFGTSVDMFGRSCWAQFGVPRLLDRNFSPHLFLGLSPRLSRRLPYPTFLAANVF
jgi:hypothetical protein